MASPLVSLIAVLWVVRQSLHTNNLQLNYLKQTQCQHLKHAYFCGLAQILLVPHLLQRLSCSPCQSIFTFPLCCIRSETWTLRERERQTERERERERGREREREREREVYNFRF